MFPEGTNKKHHSRVFFLAFPKIIQVCMKVAFNVNTGTVRDKVLC